MTLSAREYLFRTGAIELLCEIHPEGSRFQELIDEVSISKPTLSRRLLEGREVSLLETESMSGERGTTHKHVLTPRGATIRMLLMEQGIHLDYQQYKQARKRFEGSLHDFRDTVTENPPNLSDQERNEENLKTLLERTALSDMLEE